MVGVVVQAIVALAVHVVVAVGQAVVVLAVHLVGAVRLLRRTHNEKQ